MKSFKTKKFWLLLILLTSTISILLVWFYQHSKYVAKDIQNILLISIDTCRSDYLSSYGYSDETTPNIDELAKEGIRFVNAYSPVPITLPAHSTMLTGTLPIYHRVHDNSDYRLDESMMTIAEILRQNSFQTGAILSAFVMDSRFGLAQGFDSYFDRFEKKMNSAVGNERRGDETSLLAIDWIEKHKNSNFFLFLHYFDPHWPYNPPEPFASQFKKNLYAGEIAYTDYHIGKVINKLKGLGLYDSTLIIVTSDHGEMLGEHGEETHTYFIYQSAIKVPLIIKPPGLNFKARKINTPVGLVDILPTICGAINIDIPEQVQGEDLSKYFLRNQKPEQERYLYCQSLLPTKYDGNSLLGVVSNKWKYIQTTRPELYDITEDPQENNNQINQKSRIAQNLKDRLKQILNESGHSDRSGNRILLNSEEKKRLESLGYIGSAGIKNDFTFDQNNDDPKDLLHFYKMNIETLRLMKDKKYAEAKLLVKNMLLERPKYLRSYISLYQITKEQGNMTEAISYLNEMIQHKPEEDNKLKFTVGFEQAYNDLGNFYAREGDLEKAVTHYADAIKINPDRPEIHYNFAQTLKQKGDLDAAEYHLRKTIVLWPTNMAVYHNLGDVLVMKGDLTEAIQQYMKALEIEPNNVDLPMNIGKNFESNGNIVEAIPFYQKALAIQPDDPVILDRLAVTYAKTNQEDMAISLIKKRIAVQPEANRLYYNIACLYARQNKIDQAIMFLAEAIDKGYNNWKKIKTDGDLESIRSYPQYKNMIEGH